MRFISAFGLFLSLGVSLVVSGCSSGGSSGSGPSPSHPIANAGGPYTARIGAAVSFSGAASSDPQGQALTYAWNFGDSTSGTGVSPTHTYTSAGTFTVLLTVTDTSNLSGAATATATITAQPPVANAGGPYTGKTGTAVSFSGSGSTDPQSQTLTYAWNFGDGATGTSATPAHTYTSAGSFTVSLTVTNTSGLTSTATATATIAAQAPVANAGGPYTGLAGTAIGFSGSGSTDPQAQTLTYAWNFGDNTTGTGATPTHTYAAVGSYTVSLTVTNTSGLSSAASTSAVITTTGVALSGSVHSGSQVVSGAHVYLFAAGTSGYGKASVDVLSAATTGYSDAIGAYVPTAANGSFTVPAGYACSAGTQLYVFAAGGTIGTFTNSAAGLLAAVGTCANFRSSTTVWVNEVSTVAAAYTMAGFATDALHVSSSGTALAQTGVANAFANAANLASISTGAALATTPAGGGVVPQKTIDTLANILQACVASTGSVSTECSTLFANAPSVGTPGVAPADTATAAINIAHNPTANVAALYGSASTAAFSPALAAQPTDFSIGLVFGGNGLTLPGGIAIDASGNAWITNSIYPGSVVELSSVGAVLSGSNGFTGGGFDAPVGIAIDETGNVWVANSGFTAKGGLVELSNTGAVLSGAAGYSWEGELYGAHDVAVDGSGLVWTANYNQNYRLARVWPDGSAMFTLGNGRVDSGGINVLSGLAIDPSGNAWIADVSDIVEVSGNGKYLSGSNGYEYSPSFGNFQYVAIDHAGNAWITGLGITKLSPTGTNLSGGGVYGGVHGYMLGIAIDGAGNVWVSNDIPLANSLSEFSSSGVVLSGAYGYTGGSYSASAGAVVGGTLNMGKGVAVDGSGNVWVVNSGSLSTGIPVIGSVTEIIGAGSPVVTPLSANLAAPYLAAASKP